MNPLPLNSSGVNTAVDVVAPILVAATAKGVEGLKPPWNQPQDTPAALRLSPTLRPVSETASRVEQSS